MSKEITDEDIDLCLRRKNYKPKPEDKIILPEQKETGKMMDEAIKREYTLRNNAKEFDISDYTKILYRLPLTETQMKEIHKNLTSHGNI
jgi:hypothetical protein